MSATAVPTLMCRPSLHKSVDLMTDSDKGKIKCPQCKAIGSEFKEFECSHDACAGCVRKTRRSNGEVSCPECGRKHDEKLLKEDTARMLRVQEAIKRINLTSKESCYSAL